LFVCFITSLPGASPEKMRAADALNARLRAHIAALGSGGSASGGGSANGSGSANGGGGGVTLGADLGGGRLAARWEECCAADQPLTLSAKGVTRVCSELGPALARHAVAVEWATFKAKLA
jgi:hypothetical protein